MMMKRKLPSSLAIDYLLAISLDTVEVAPVRDRRMLTTRSAFVKP